MEPWEMIGAADGSRALVCLPLARSGLPHLFTLRPAGGPAAQPASSVPRSLLEQIGLGEVRISRPIQIHGARVAAPSPEGETTDPAQADAVIVHRPPGGAAVLTADCVGAILQAPRSRAFAVVHAGWRGTLAAVLPEAIGALGLACGAKPAELSLAIGPAIGRCCYEVGEDVADPFRRAFPGSAWPSIFGERGGRTTLDLVAANRHQAESCGLDRGRIHAAGVCTACRRDLCWSYRVEGRSSGRMWTLAGLAS